MNAQGRTNLEGRLGSRALGEVIVAAHFMAEVCWCPWKVLVYCHWQWKATLQSAGSSQMSCGLACVLAEGVKVPVQTET